MSNQQNIDKFFASFQQKLEQAQQKLPDIIGTEVINSTIDNFKSESFFGDKWKPRKDKKNTNNLLIKTGRLWRDSSWKVTKISINRIIISNNTPYAEIHNNGGTINRAARSETFIRNRHTKGKKGKMFGGMGAFRKGTTAGQGQTYKNYSMTMPMRKFLGIHPKLQAALEDLIKEEIQTAFK